MNKKIYLYILGLIKETFTQSNNITITLIYCWSPNESDLLSNHAFMISRQILRLIVYYIMPLIFVSVFYILIAKHLFQAKGVILKPVLPQSSINDRSNSKREQLNNGSKKQSLNDNQDKMSTRSVTHENGKLMKKHELLPGVPSPTSSLSSLTNTIRRNKDHLYGNSTLNNNNNNSLVIHTLYRDAKTRKQLRARHKVAKTVLFLCSVFFICWLPKQIHDLYW